MAPPFQREGPLVCCAEAPCQAGCSAPLQLCYHTGLFCSSPIGASCRQKRGNLHQSHWPLGVSALLAAKLPSHALCCEYLHKNVKNGSASSDGPKGPGGHMPGRPFPKPLVLGARMICSLSCIQDGACRGHTHCNNACIGNTSISVKATPQTADQCREESGYQHHSGLVFSFLQLCVKKDPPFSWTQFRQVWAQWHS